MRTLLVCLFSFFATAAFAEDGDPPGRVGRLSTISGNVSFRPAGLEDDDWVAAVPNRPITIGDAIWVDEGGRAVLHIGSTTIAIDERTAISVLALDEDVTQLALTRGRIVAHVRGLDRDDVVEIDLPNSASRVRRSGTYSFAYDEARDDSRVGVRRGSVDVTAHGHTFDVDEGQLVTLAGEGNVTYDMNRLGAPDRFEGWSLDRDRKEDQLASLRYVSRDMTGYDDLDQYGSWSVTADNGAVWYPTQVQASWVPYRYGHWSYVAPWGWTWIDDMPWGFAPFHYGRWVNSSGRWGWAPGQNIRRAVYAPALVAWVGDGGPSMGWFPLGPREVYVPSYRVSPRYLQRVNVAHVQIGLGPYSVTHVHYVNRAPAFSAVPREVFINARPVAPAVSYEHGISKAPILSRVGWEPRRASFAAPPVSARPPAAASQRPVMTVRTPSRPAPMVQGGGAPPPRMAPVRSAIPSGQSAPPQSYQPRQGSAPPPRAAPAPSAPPRSAAPAPAPRAAPAPSQRPAAPPR